MKRSGLSSLSVNTLAGGAPTATTKYTPNPRLRYPYQLNLYTSPPSDEITLEQFEEWALDRLRVLAEVEACQARSRPWAEQKSIIEARMKQYMPLSPSSAAARGVDLDAERKKDHYSHFVLRLAFCRSEELRGRFLRAEQTLFRIRFELADNSEKNHWLASLKFDWQPVPPEEKEQFRSQLSKASFMGKSIETENFLRVPWMRVADLISQRKVFVHRGMAYVPQTEKLSLIANEFSSALASTLERTAKALPRLDEDDRLVPVLGHLSMGFMAGLSSEYDIGNPEEKGELITAEMIEELSKKHFPPCMRSLQHIIRTEHHLKHEGRQQYNLFLKGIGLPIEEALVFFRKGFSKCTDDKFNKEYRYNIRHGYGLEGSRKNYTPRSCLQIITGKVPGAQETHGCPFKHYATEALSTTLNVQYGVTGADLREVLGAVKTQHFHVACTRVFEIQHAAVGVKKGDGLGAGESVNHPNKWFDQSRAVFKVAADEDPEVLAARAAEAAEMDEDERAPKKVVPTRTVVVGDGGRQINPPKLEEFEPAPVFKEDLEEESQKQEQEHEQESAPPSEPEQSFVEDDDEEERMWAEMDAEILADAEMDLSFTSSSVLPAVEAASAPNTDSEEPAPVPTTVTAPAALIVDVEPEVAPAAAAAAVEEAVPVEEETTSMAVEEEAAVEPVAVAVAVEEVEEPMPVEEEPVVPTTSDEKETEAAPVAEVVAEVDVAPEVAPAAAAVKEPAMEVDEA